MRAQRYRAAIFLRSRLSWSQRDPALTGMPRRGADRSLVFRMGVRACLRLNPFAVRLGPGVAAKVDPVDHLVPEPLVRGDLLRDKLAVVRLRQFIVGSERSESGAHVEPERGGLETGRRPVARPAILFRALDHLGADRVEDNVPQYLGQVRFLLDEKGLESSAVEVP